MGLLDDIMSQQNGGGITGTLPWGAGYVNPDSLTPHEKELMALVGTQNPQDAGFNPLPPAAATQPQGILGLNSPFGAQMPNAAPAAAPTAQAAAVAQANAAQDALPAPAAAPGAAPSVPISPPGLNGTLPGTAPPPINAPQFGAGAQPFIFPQAGGLPPQPSAAPAAAAKPPVVAADDDDDAPAAPAQASPIGVGNYQMPRVGPAAAFTPGPAAPAAPPTPAPAAPASPLDTIGDHLKASWQSMRNGGGLIGGVSGLVTGQRDDPVASAQAIQSHTANLTAQALIAKGVDPKIVMAAVQPGNGEMLKALLPTLTPQAYTQETDKDGNVWNVNKDTGQKTVALQPKDDKFQHVKTKDALGNETSQVFNTKTGDITTPAGTASVNGPGFATLLKQGVTYDPNKTGDEYMAQFSPEVQAAAKAYINGDVMPTGNARKDSVATFAKTIAQKYGQDTGVPVNDVTFSAKRTLRNQLAMSSNSSMGGILSNGESSFKHLAEYTNSVSDQGNASHDFPLGGVASHVQNWVGNSLGGSDTFAKIKAINDNLGHYGQESTKFYAGTGGGVEERMNALKEMNPTTTSGEEAAAYAEKEKGLMVDRLTTKLQEIRNTLGEKEGNAEIAKHMPDIEKNIATIDANIARLRGQPATAAAPSGAAPATGKLPAGNYIWNPQTNNVVKQ